MDLECHTVFEVGGVTIGDMILEFTKPFYKQMLRSVLLS